MCADYLKSNLIRHLHYHLFVVFRTVGEGVKERLLVVDLFVNHLTIQAFLPVLFFVIITYI